MTTTLIFGDDGNEPEEIVNASFETIADGSSQELIEPQLAAIRAGAGAGKTTRITLRYVNHIVRDGLSPLEVVAVTFTDAAAMELRSRIREKLQESLGKDDDRLAELEAARISTFHSMAAAICRQHPVEAEVPADFALLDEVQGALWLSDKVDDALDSLPEEIFQNIPFSRLRPMIRALLSDPIAASSSLNADYENTLDVMEQARSKAYAALISSDEWVNARRELGNTAGDPIDKLEIIRQSVVKAIRTFEIDHASIDSLKAIDAAAINVGTQKNWPVPTSTIKSAIKDVRESVRSAIKLGIVTLVPTEIDAAMQARIEDLKKAYEIVQTELARSKTLERLLDYADLEVHAMKALEHPNICAFYQARWKAFVVDEYQDTNPVQDEILKRLRNDSTRRAIVGDANQSIYGFRRADPTLIDRAAHEIVSSGGLHESLDTNYRTHSGLVADMNCLFQNLFAGADQAFVPQESVRQPPPMGEVGEWLRILQVAPPADKRPRSFHMRVEAINIARMLNELVESGTEIFDKELKVHRPVRWGDMAIIARSWSSLDPYADALGSLGIPHVHMGGGNLMDTREARDGYALLRFLADPDDDLALAAVLKSPLFSVSDLTLYDLRSSSKVSLLESLQLAAEQQGGSLRMHFELISDLLIQRHSDSPSRLLHIADVKTGLSSILRSLPSGDRRLADWRGFCALIVEIEKTSFDTFTAARVLRRLEIARSDRSARVEIPRPALEAGNAISLMTVHRSKGLEWPVVVMADLAKTARRDDSSILFDPLFGVALKVEDAEATDQPMLFRFLKHRVTVREAQEEKRLLYVAATRARDYLIMASVKPMGRTAVSLLMPGLEMAGRHMEYWEYKPEDAQPPKPKPSKVMAREPLDFSGTDINAVPKQIPVTSLAVYKNCPKQFWYRHVMGHPGIGDGNDVYGRVGTLIHTAIQYGIDRADVLHRHDRSLPEDDVKTALMAAQYYRSSPLFARFRSSDAKFEQSIMLQLEGLTITGRIDLIGPDFIVDFKSRKRRREQDYLMQLWIYAEVEQREDLVICYLDGNKPTKVKKADMEWMRPEILNLAHQIRAGNFKASPEAAKCSFCRYRTICPDSAELLVEPSDEELADYQYQYTPIDEEDEFLQSD